MHMADALISAAVGGTMLAVSSGAIAYSSKRVQNDLDDKKIPLMGVMGAFVFAAQMINFSIPGTGSSGHLGGGMLLAILLGSHAGFLTISAVLLIEALVFGDGGLLAYGCNVFNLGFYTCFIAYPYIYKTITKKELNIKRIVIGAVTASIIGLQLGAFSVVMETLLSGKTELTFGTFVLLMQPIHLGIGIVEGLVTAAIVSFVWKSRPEIIEKTASGELLGNTSIKRVLIGFIVAVVVIGGGLSWFASSKPDGLEWSILKTTGTTELEGSSPIHNILSSIQSKIAFLPDYDFKAEGEKESGAVEGEASLVNAGTSTSGLVGGALTLGLIVLAGTLISLFKRKKTQSKF